MTINPSDSSVRTHAPPLQNLSKPDSRLSHLVLGTMTFGDTTDTAEARSIFDAALDAGITGVDTANGYAGGRTESILGELLASKRDQVALASKAGIPHPDSGDASPLSGLGLRRAVEGSLSRLKVDHLDLLYLHQPDRNADAHETLQTVAALIKEGKIGAWGISNYSAWQIMQLQQIAHEVGATQPVIAQQLYSLLARRLEEEYTEMAAVTGIATMVYNPLAGGLLTGRHDFKTDPDSGRFGDSTLASMYRSRYWSPQLFEAVSDLSRIADDAGLPLIDLALRWLLSRPVTDFILLGASRRTQLEANLETLNQGPLPEDVITACDDVGTRLRGPMPAYNR